MLYHVHYSTPQDVTNPGYDGRMIGFPLSFVPVEFVGLPEESTKTTEHRVVVSIDGSTVAVWRLSGEALVRVTFEYARRFLKSALEKSQPICTYTVHAPIISIHKEHGPCPFDPARIPAPEGFTEQIEIHKRMGFGA